MKNKGFTLIELLAVIVILAIIALIAVPIILNIIGDAKNESDKRSIELYGNAVKNAVAKVQLDGTEVTPGLLDEEFLSKVEYDGSEVNCKITRLNTDGTIYLDECTVNGNAVDYKYGVARWYYSWTTDNNHIGDALPDDFSLNPPLGKDYYLGLETNDGSIVSAAYACFKKDGKEYCLKGGDGGASYKENQEIIRKVFSSNSDSCSFGDSESECNEGLRVFAHSDGYVGVYGSGSYCEVCTAYNVCVGG